MNRHARLCTLAAIAATLAVLGAAAAPAQSAPAAATPDEIRERYQGTAQVGWRALAGATDPVKVRLIGLNDLHGNLETRERARGADGERPMGGAAVLAAYLAVERQWNAKRTLLLLAGDSIGASAPVSGLLRDEPTLAFLNELVDGDCPRLTRPRAAPSAPLLTRCRVLAAVGNHEFDRGSVELERLLYGGRAPGADGGDWRGSRVPFLAANVVRRADRSPLLPAAAIVDLDGVKIGVIGAVTLATASLVPAARTMDLQFLPEVAPIDAQVAALKAAGVGTIVLVIHEGLQAPTQPQPYPLLPDEVSGRLGEIARELAPGVDVIVSGHTHKPTNLLLKGRDPRPILIVQARSAGTAYSEIELTLDRAAGGTTVAKSAQILTTWADAGPGQEPDKGIARQVAAAARLTAARTARVVGQAAARIARDESPDGESALGNLVADAQRAAAGSEFAFMNPGGLRADLEAGPITWGALYAVHPFGNQLLRMTLTGAQILDLLEQQWSGPHSNARTVLRVSGLRYVYDPGRAPGSRVLSASDANGAPLDPARRYTVAANDFLAGGGDFFPAFAAARDVTPVGVDVDALEAYVARAKGPLEARIEGRVRRASAP